jgi:hypothetical protein
MGTDEIQRWIYAEANLHPDKRVIVERKSSHKLNSNTDPAVNDDDLSLHQITQRAAQE